MMNLRDSIPPRWKPLLRRFADTSQLLHLKRVERILRQNDLSRGFLTIDQIPILLSEFEKTVPASDEYSKEKLDIRGNQRARKIAQLVPFEIGSKTLELGAGDGMTSAHLIKSHKADAYCIDILDTSDQRAHSAGVKFRIADAHSLPFSDEEFSVVFSFAALEHFEHPDKILLEAMRVVRPGGYVYLEFGLLFFSPYGLHAYREFPFSYPQLLFSFEDLVSFVANKRPQPDWVRRSYLNRYHYNQYRRLFDSHEGNFRIVFYDESPDFTGLQMIERYPACFKLSELSMKDFVTNAIMVLLQKLSV